MSRTALFRSRHSPLSPRNLKRQSWRYDQDSQAMARVLDHLIWPRQHPLPPGRCWVGDGSAASLRQGRDVCGNDFLVLPDHLTNMATSQPVSSFAIARQSQRTVVAQDGQPDANNGLNAVPPPTGSTMEADGRLDL